MRTVFFLPNSKAFGIMGVFGQCWSSARIVLQLKQPVFGREEKECNANLVQNAADVLAHISDVLTLSPTSVDA